MRALLVLLAAALCSTATFADPPKRARWGSAWDVLTVLHGPAPDSIWRQHVAPPPVAQEPAQKKPKPHKPPKPCNCGGMSYPESEVGNAAFQSGDGAG